MRNWLKSLFVGQGGSLEGNAARRGSRKRTTRPMLDTLEDRFAPAILPMTSFGAGFNLVRFPIESAVRETLNVALPTLTIDLISPAANSSFNHNFTIAGQLNIGNVPGLVLEAQTDSGAFVAVTPNASGQFSLTTGLSLAASANGNHTVKFRASDLSQRTATRSLVFRIDTVAPVISTFDITTASDDGVAGDHLTSLAIISLQGTTEAGSKVVLANTGAVATADSAGSFTIPAIALANGATTFTINVTDLAGNVSTMARVINRDATIPTVTAALSHDNGISTTDKITNDPTITGTVTQSATVTEFRASLDDSVTANFVDVTAQLVGGVFTFDLAQLKIINHDADVTEGAHTLRVFAKNANGNSSTVLSLAFTLDRASTTPTLTLDAASDTDLPGDNVTSLGSVNLSGTAEAGASIVLENSQGNSLGTATANSSGVFTFTGIALQEGANALTVKATDTAGNLASFPRTLTRDSTIPAVTAALSHDTGTSATDKITNDPAIAGTVTQSATVTELRASLDDALTANFVDVTAQLVNGAFTFNAAQMKTINHGNDLTAGSHTLRVFAKNANGSSSAVFSLVFTLDLASTTPTLTLDSISDSGTAGDQTTSLTSVTLSGVAEAGASIVLENSQGTSLGTATADVGGNYSIAAIALQDGTNAFTVKATDLAGNLASFTRTITRANSTPTVLSVIAGVTTPANSVDKTIDLAAHFTDADMTRSLIRFNTSAGAINLELFDTETPQTVANLFNYINNGSYNNAIFHRNATNFVLQGGGFKFNAATHTLDAIPAMAPVPNEFAIANTVGTIAMAKQGGNPNSATNQFFFNVADNTSTLGATNNGGFTVFGKIVGSADQAIINTLTSTAPVNKGSPFDEIPLKSYTGTNFPTDATAANFLTISDVTTIKRTEFLTYSILSNSNPTLVTATLNASANEMLTLHFNTNQTGTATITIRATDRFGATVDSSFQITVPLS